MNVRCPSCETVFRVDPAKVPEAGTRARCTVCAYVIAVRRSEDGATGATAPVRPAWPQPAAGPPAPPPRAATAGAPAAPAPRVAAPPAPAASPAAAPAPPAPRLSRPFTGPRASPGAPAPAPPSAGPARVAPQ
ncbi:MAG: zinc-ribbon domain-containing protein, partial [Gemmatimonadetes bacterium]|nr:zinc-ribbon domain-containing protein [Gemmatimonadota bacterium]